MASEYIGCVISATTGKIVAVINPDDDSELDNPRWLLFRWSPKGESIETDAMRMVKIRRADYESKRSMVEVAAMIGANE